MIFKDIYGHIDLKQKLRDMVQSNHIPHALLINGQEGSPVLPMALAFSTYINCENNLDSDDACGTCASCVKNEKFIHPDLNFFFPVSGTDKVKSKDASSLKFMKEWREFLLSNPFGNLGDWANTFGGENKQLIISREESRIMVSAISLKAFEGKYKLMLVWLPEYMHPAGANAILKILEEPSDKTIFLLVSQDRERLLSTIVSRTQSIFVRKFEAKELIGILTEKHGIDTEEARKLARLSDGSLRQALNLKMAVSGDNTLELKTWFRECFKLNVKELVLRADSFHKQNKLAQRTLLNYALSTIRESLIHKLGGSEVNYYTPEEEGFVKDFSKVITGEKAGKISELISDSYYYLDRNGNAKIVFMDLSLQIAKTLKEQK